MDIQKILQCYDQMYGHYSLNEIENYLIENINEAIRQDNIEVVFTLLNEMIGFCRDTTQNEKGLIYCQQLEKVLNMLNIEGTVEYGTCLLNLANAYRAFGYHERSLQYFQYTESIYAQLLQPYDFGWANLYNNWGLLYQETHEYQLAVETLYKALVVVDQYDEAFIRQAVTRSNLAAALIQMHNEKAYEYAMVYLKEALKIYEDDGGRDFHYPAALVSMGDAYSYVEDYQKAKDYYYRGLKELERHVGRNENYMRVLEKYHYVCQFVGNDHHWQSNLERSQAFYECYGKEMIHHYFQPYENRIAVGMIGEGSDCYGFDDEISSDHDYDIGFCMWLNEKDYDEIGDLLQKQYEKLLIQHGCLQNGSLLEKRRGVFSINDFYNQLLKTQRDYEHLDIDFYQIDEQNLSLATNGLVFYDGLGLFTSIRRHLLNDCPEDLWKRKLAEKIHNYSQYAQSNYSRMMARHDFVTAQLCVSKAIETAMDLVYLLEYRYAPYYKWKRKGLENLELGQKFLPILDELVCLPVQKEAWEGVLYSSSFVNENDRCIILFETLAKMILNELKHQHIVDGDEVFLEVYVQQILGVNKMNDIDKIIELEWQQFDKVQNEGGRASCQNNYPTFLIMRKSQYLTWNEELLKSFYNDLVEAENKGWNLITEKYARMMKSTSPAQYAEFEKDLPILNEQREAIQEEIIKIQVHWMEEFAKHYPKMAGNARCIHTYEDTIDRTSYETYLRGEMSTYSDHTFMLYGQFIVNLVTEDKNLAYEIMQNTAHLYGYKTLEDAENHL